MTGVCFRPKSIFIRAVSVLLIFSMLLPLVSCAASNAANKPSLPSPNVILIEDIQYEDIINEAYLTEDYWYEDEIFENALIEALLAEDTITEVYAVEYLVIEKDAADFFAEEELSAVFGEKFDYNQVLNKFAAGGGVILVTAIVSVVGHASPYASYLSLPLKQAVKYASQEALIGAAEGGISAIDPRLGLAVALADLIDSIAKTIASAPTPVTLTLGIASLVMSGQRFITAIDTYKNTDVANVSWNSVDWEKAGYTALDSGATGFEFGAIIGAITGSIQAAIRIRRFIRNTNIDENGVRTYKLIPKTNGRWAGKPGDSEWIPDRNYVPAEKGGTAPYSNPNNLTMGELLDEVGLKSIPFQDGYPDFSKIAKHTVFIRNFTADRSANFLQADIALARLLNDTPANIEAYRKAMGYAWHEVEDMGTMMLVPHEIHANVPHRGGVSEYIALMKGE